MHNTSESPRDAEDCSLSQILQVDAPLRYSLSRKACLGILHRAENRHKELPPMLKAALMEVAIGSDGVPIDEDNEADDEGIDDEDEYESEE